MTDLNQYSSLLNTYTSLKNQIDIADSLRKPELEMKLKETEHKLDNAKSELLKQRGEAKDPLAEISGGKQSYVPELGIKIDPKTAEDYKTHLKTQDNKALPAPDYSSTESRQWESETEKKLVLLPIKESHQAYNVLQVEALTGQKVPAGTAALEDFLSTNKGTQPLTFGFLHLDGKHNHYVALQLNQGTVTAIDSNGERLTPEIVKSIQKSLGADTKIQYVGKDGSLIAAKNATDHNLFDPQFKEGKAGSEHECTCGMHTANSVAALKLLAAGNQVSFANALQNMHDTPAKEQRAKHSGLLHEGRAINPAELGKPAVSNLHKEAKAAVVSSLKGAMDAQPVTLSQEQRLAVLQKSQSPVRGA